MHPTTLLSALSLLLVPTATLAIPASVRTSGETGTRAVTRGSLASNVAGAYYNSTSQGTYQSITATIAVPKDALTFVSASIGLNNAASCPSGFLSLGIHSRTFGPFPIYLNSYNSSSGGSSFADFSYTAGDTVQLTITATSSTAATFQISNLRTGQQLSKDVTSTSTYCLQDAEWLVTVPTTGPPATITFNNATVTTSEQATQGPANATVSTAETGTSSVKLTSDSVIVQYS